MNEFQKNFVIALHTPSALSLIRKHQFRLDKHDVQLASFDLTGGADAFMEEILDFAKFHNIKTYVVGFRRSMEEEWPNPSFLRITLTNNPL
jgi:hypothetical protein